VPFDALAGHHLAGKGAFYILQRRQNHRAIRRGGRRSGGGIWDRAEFRAQLVFVEEFEFGW